LHARLFVVFVHLHATHLLATHLPATHLFARTQSLKGVGGNIVILEEAAYCDTQVVNEVVLPLLSMRDSVLLCISTLLESSNHYSRMFTLTTPNGQPLFETMQISLVCDACLASDHPEKCTHRAAEMPRWLSSSKMETIKTLLADDPALLMRESMGISAETTTRAFSEGHVEAFFTRPHMMPSRLEYVYTSVDPAGGGSSNFAIASIGMMTDGRVIVRSLLPLLNSA
jgi:hypothetical protein